MACAPGTASTVAASSTRGHHWRRRDSYDKDARNYRGANGANVLLHLLTPILARLSD
jgi:hypothetical protein